MQFCGVVIVLDVGTTTSGSGFLTTGLNCAAELVQRKLFAESPDRFGLVMVGTDKTDNPLNYEYVTVLKDGLFTADWELVNYLDQHVQGIKFACFALTGKF